MIKTGTVGEVDITSPLKDRKRDHILLACLLTCLRLFSL